MLARRGQASRCTIEGATAAGCSIGAGSAARCSASGFKTFLFEVSRELLEVLSEVPFTAILTEGAPLQS